MQKVRLDTEFCGYVFVHFSEVRLLMCIRSLGSHNFEVAGKHWFRSVFWEIWGLDTSGLKRCSVKEEVPPSGVFEKCCTECPSFVNLQCSGQIEDSKNCYCKETSLTLNTMGTAALRYSQPWIMSYDSSCPVSPTNHILALHHQLVLRDFMKNRSTSGFNVAGMFRSLPLKKEEAMLGVV
jgi:hypothetical protein